jgi:hypothetical protein
MNIYIYIIKIKIKTLYHVGYFDCA